MKTAKALTKDSFMISGRGIVLELKHTLLGPLCQDSCRLCESPCYLAIFKPTQFIR
jgi:hypothetical protein